MPKTKAYPQLIKKINHRNHYALITAEDALSYVEDLKTLSITQLNQFDNIYKAIRSTATCYEAKKAFRANIRNDTFSKLIGQFGVTWYCLKLSTVLQDAIANYLATYNGLTERDNTFEDNDEVFESDNDDATFTLNGKRTHSESDEDLLSDNDGNDSFAPNAKRRKIDVLQDQILEMSKSLEAIKNQLLGVSNMLNQRLFQPLPQLQQLQLPRPQTQQPRPQQSQPQIQQPQFPQPQRPQQPQPQIQQPQFPQPQQPQQQLPVQQAHFPHPQQSQPLGGALRLFGNPSDQGSKLPQANKAPRP